MNIWKAIKKLILAGADRNEVADIIPSLEKRYQEDGGQGSGNFGHKGRKGQRGGSSKEGGSEAGGSSGLAIESTGQAGTRELKVNSASWRHGSSSGANRFRRGFGGRGDMTPEQNAEDHFMRHGMREMGIQTVEEYIDKAVALGTSPVGGDIVGGRNWEGQIVRYNTRTRELFIGNPRSGNIITYMISKYGQSRQKAYEYYQAQIASVDLSQ